LKDYAIMASRLSTRCPTRHCKTPIMLEKPGDLIPVTEGAKFLPWHGRRSKILNFLHRGKVTFTTLVYDTNVGDISTLGCYFNSERISVDELNSRYGSSVGGEGPGATARVGREEVAVPRLLLYPEHHTEAGNTDVQEGEHAAASMWPEVGQGRALEGARREEVELLLMDDSDQQRAQAAESSLTAAMDMVSRVLEEC
jgi:hypothetical protein